ncbi:molybdopterin converting factor subunit 1 [Priestia megaterium]|jgi:molybdopterin synthase sulfur carrier subunit|uniref:molybdopterin converting factor subunit 1 n=1 Tax=Priestia megaterium TaxID=1404 RepID=UPI002281C27C|nr:molybdopterin converting factor subunit 1 [Priestia megaterium]MCY9018357.1 molybdopterin converting factor subunit 1 [Priestia megaterium]MCY9022500.1 molybdopterin converting factor subunit 1 [Priestia megaterium]
MINVLFFAAIREEAGVEQVTVDMQDITVKELKEYVQKTYKLSSLKQTMTAVNEEFVTDEETIRTGDTVAFIPPVSGG